MNPDLRSRNPATFSRGRFNLAASIFSSVSAERRQIEASGEYVFGDSEESPAVAKERARVYALRNASQQAGVFVESIVKVKNMMLTEDEIRTISSNVLQVAGEPQFKNEVTADGKGFIIRCKLVAIVDDDNISAELMKDRQSLDEAVRMNREYENRIRELNDEIEKLKRDRANAKTESEIKIIDEQIKQNDDGFTAVQYVDMGFKAWEAQKYSEAIDYYNRAIELDPKNSGAYDNRGNAYRDQGNWTQAINDYDKAIELDQRNSWAYANRGFTYHLQGNFEKAMSDCNKAIEINPKNSWAYICRGIAYRDQENLTQSMNDFNKAIELDPKNSGAYDNRGNAYRDQGNWTQAINDYDKAIELDQRNSWAYNNRGYIYELLGNISQAIADYKKALTLDPNHPYAKSNLNRLQSK